MHQRALSGKPGYAWDRWRPSFEVSLIRGGQKTEERRRSIAIKGEEGRAVVGYPFIVRGKGDVTTNA